VRGTVQRRRMLHTGGLQRDFLFVGHGQLAGIGGRYPRRFGSERGPED
jgi:hypothetical protein